VWRNPDARIRHIVEPKPRLAGAAGSYFESVLAETMRARRWPRNHDLECRSQRDAAAKRSALPAGSHYLRLDVSFLAVTGTHTVYDPRAATPIVIDEDGPDSSTNSAPGAAITYNMANPDNFCGPPPTPSATAGGAMGGNIAPPLATLGPGERAGPVQMCFWVRGPVNQRLTYAWWPSGIPNTPGILYMPVTIPLP